jgi:hypothetical protein
VKRAEYPTTAAGSPTQDVTSRLARAIVSIPWAMTFGRPTPTANRSLQWMGLKSPDAPAYRTRSARVTCTTSGGRVLPGATAADAGAVTTAPPPGPR